MGRQKGQAERSKFKAASSSTFGQAGIFTGFGQSDIIDPNVDSRLKVSLRKVAKKDAVTKSKACHEILDLISEENEEREELVQPLLLAWPRFYQKLVLEHDPRVRTQSHQVTINLLLLARKQSAPHLKSIMKRFYKPSLFYGTCDEYGICSGKADQGLRAVFQTDEKIDALVAHVKKELAEYLIELVQRKAEKSAESELEIIRTSSQALRCLARYYSFGDKRLDLSVLYQSKSFWKNSRSKDAHIRAGFFELGRAALKSGDFDYIENWTKAMLSSLGEDDPLCLKPLWAGVLLILAQSKTDSKIFDYVNFLKAFVPGLWSVLRGGAYGCGSIIYPHILPLLANIPKEHAVGPFYGNFFENFRQGLSDIESKVELKHGITALLECYQYAENNQLIAGVVDSLFNIVLDTLNNEESFGVNEIAGPLYNLLSTWKAKSETKFDQFWSLLYTHFETVVPAENITNEDYKKLETCAKFIQAVHRTQRVNKRKGVHFKAKSEEAESQNDLESDLLDLIIVLMCSFGRNEPLRAAVELAIVGQLTQKCTREWMDRIFNTYWTKVYSEECENVNEKLMSTWFLPRLESALTADFSFSADKSVLSLSNDVILHLANQSAVSCAKVLNVSSTPSTIMPLLPFITRTIAGDNGEESAKLLLEYYQKCNLSNSVDRSCVEILLKEGPTSVKDFICTDMASHVENCDSMNYLYDLVSLRFSRNDSSELTVQIIGQTWSKLFIDGGEYKSDLAVSSKIIDLLLMKNDFTVYEPFFVHLFENFTHNVSTMALAKIIEFTVLLKQSADEDSEPVLSDELYGVIESAGSKLLAEMGNLDTVSRPFNQIYQLVGLQEVTDEKFGSMKFEYFLLQILLNKVLGKFDVEESIQLLSGLESLVCQTNESWTAVQLGPEFPLETFGYILFEFSLLSKSAVTDETDYDLVMADILTNVEKPDHKLYHRITKSEDNSHLIGALEQLRIIGMGEFSESSSAKANFCSLFAKSVAKSHDEFTSDQWDFVLCNIVEWLDDLVESMDHCLFTGVCRALSTVGNYLNSPQARSDPSLPPDLLSTWTDFFLPQIVSSVFQVLIKTECENVIIDDIIWSSFTPLAKLANLGTLQSLEVPLLLSPELTCPDNINSMFNHFFKQLRNGVNRRKQLILCDMIKLLLPLIVIKNDREPPEYILNKAERLVNQNEDISGSVLAIDICLEMIKLNSSYLYYFLGSSHCSVLLDKIWNMLPEGSISDKNAPNSLLIRSHFAENRNLAVFGILRIADVCPGVIRYWQKGIESKNVQREIQKFCQDHLSENLVRKELQNVNIPGINCVPYIKSRSLLATYIMDDLHIEIMITLPIDWPLSPASIEGLRSVGVTGSEWRLWLFQLEQALATGAGLVAGLTRWSGYLKKKFDNLEECYICYSIIYGKGQQLPRLPCKTCGKKFHTECLYKWFSSSNNSTCPLCRSPMIFG